MSLKILAKRLRQRRSKDQDQAETEKHSGIKEDDSIFGFGIIRRPQLLKEKVTAPRVRERLEERREDEHGFLEELRDRARQRRR